MEGAGGITVAGYYISVYSKCVRTGGFKGYAAGKAQYQVTALGIETDVYFTQFFIIGGIITVLYFKYLVFL